MKGLKKKVISLTFVLVLVLATVTTAYASSTGNTTLIKRENTVEGYTEVTSTSTAGFGLTVKRADDEFNIYQLTEITWTTVNGIETAVIDWNADLKTWLADATNGFTDAKYATPKALGEAEDVDGDGTYEDETAVITLLRAIREDAALMAALDANYKVAYHTGTDYSQGNSTHAEGNNLGTVTPSTSTDGSSTVLNGYTVSDMPFGLFFVDAKGGTRTYQPVLANFMPEQVGPTGHWYIKNNQQFTLKYEDVGVVKKINGEDYDIVREGELVDFDVEVEIPAYQKNQDGNYQYTLFNAFDDMSQGFTLVPASAVLTYEDKEGNIVHPNANMSIDPYGNMTLTDVEGTYTAVLATGANVYYSTTDGQDVLFGTQTTTAGQIQFWGLVNGYLEQVGAFAESTAAYTAALNSYNDRLRAAGLPVHSYTAASIQKREYTKSFITIRFNYTTLMDTLTYTPASSSTPEAFTPYKMKVSYAAKVNNTAYVGDDSNTNDVYLYYIGDSAGNVQIAQDEVVGWTYAANIVKVDGDTYETDVIGEDPDTGEPIYQDPTYLENAIFDLYRLDTTYCGGSTATTEPGETEYAGYSFYNDSDGNTSYETSRTAWAGSAANGYTDGLLYKAIQYHYASDPTLTTTDAVAQAVQNKLAEMTTTTESYATLDKFTSKYAFAAASTDNLGIIQEYVLPDVTGMSYQYIPELVDSCDKCATPHYHVHAYSVYWNGVTSTNTAEGVTVTGLDPSSYLLVENTAPDNYNKLSEAIQFEVTEYDGTQYIAAGNSYKGFISDDGTNYTDGTYAIVVKNFKGIVLPSTGGMGTLLFTIIGVCLMAGAFTIVLIRNRKKRQELL